MAHQVVHTIHQVDPRTLAGADYNPRKMSARQRRSLEQSLSEFGFVQPIIVNKASDVVVGGHQRLTAALSLGWTEVPVVYVELTEAREKALNVALNKISGDWDFEALVEILQDLDADGDNGFDLTGFDFDEYQAIEAALNEEVKPGREGDVKPPPRNPLSKEGEVYQLGRHTLVCGDSCDPASYSHTDTKVRMQFCDPPYNVAYEGGTDEKLTILNDKFDTKEQYRDFLVAFLNAANAKNDGVTYMCYSSSESEAVHSAWRIAAHHDSSDIHAVVDQEPPAKKKRAKVSKPDIVLWDKEGFTLGRSHYQAGHEPILYGWHKGAKNKHWCGDRTQSNVWQYAKPTRNKEHPTMKPVPLVERAIRNSSEPGDWVLDGFGGSGSTLVAAENIGRNAYIVELDPRFIDVIIARYQSLDGAGNITRTIAVPDSNDDGWWNLDQTTTDNTDDDNDDTAETDTDTGEA